MKKTRNARRGIPGQKIQSTPTARPTEARTAVSYGVGFFAGAGAAGFGAAGAAVAAAFIG